MSQTGDDDAAYIRQEIVEWLRIQRRMFGKLPSNIARCDIG